MSALAATRPRDIETWREPFSTLTMPKPSGWRCKLFGSDASGITWCPNEGEVPNAFWRVMQFLAFGNRWERIAEPAPQDQRKAEVNRRVEELRPALEAHGIFAPAPPPPAQTHGGRNG